MRYLALLFLPFVLYASPVVPDAYVVHDANATRYIAPAGEGLAIGGIAEYQAGVMRRYAREYGYALDQKLHLTLASKNNQIANGFSTQIPLNEQVFYGNGAIHYDRFASTSWLKTLLIHETAHTYQLNPKANFLSRFAHAIAGNVPVVNPFFVPLFPVPNITESSFVLEGNAVMNESRFGNGGRLWSGYALAQTVVQARAGNITPAKMYNWTLSYPYGDKMYLVGGHFQRFLAKRYGVTRVNRYFKRYAKQPFPFFGNAVFAEHYGKDFVTLMGEFAQSVRAEHRAFRATQGRELAKSQIRTPLVRHKDRIVTLIGDRRTQPSIVSLAPDGEIKMHRGNWHSGRVFEVNGRYYTQSAERVSVRAIRAGLFDAQGYLKAETAGKVIQGRLANGQWVYFDAAHAWEAPQLYVGDRYFGTVNSSVFVRGDHLYYFRQNGHRRTLYRDRTPLYSYRGHDGKVVDVDGAGRVYFVAPSRHGSTVYRIGHGRIERVTAGDDVLDLKLLGRGRAVVQTVGRDAYRLQTIRLHPRAAQVASLDPGLPEVTIGRIKKHDTGENDNRIAARPYGALRELRYSGLRSESTYDLTHGYRFGLEMNFVDPLWRNTLSFAMRYQKERTLLRAQYRNSAHLLRYGISVTGVYKHTGYDQSRYRDYGYSAYMTLPFLASGYWRGSASLSVARPHDDPKRQPVTLRAHVGKRVQFGLAKYPNESIGLSVFGTYDRGAVYGGVRGEWMGGLSNQLYLGVRGAYLYSSTLDPSDGKGIKAGDVATSSSDPAAMPIPSLSGSGYVTQAALGEVALYKVFDYAWYSYHLPISLQRESLYLKHRLYALDFGSEGSKRYRESVVGVEADLLMLHRYTVPLKVELLYNKDAKNKVQVRVGAQYRF
jgi:hypothetical protein